MCRATGAHRFGRRHASAILARQMSPLMPLAMRLVPAELREAVVDSRAVDRSGQSRASVAEVPDRLSGPDEASSMASPLSPHEWTESGSVMRHSLRPPPRPDAIRIARVRVPPLVHPRCKITAAPRAADSKLPSPPRTMARLPCRRSHRTGPGCVYPRAVKIRSPSADKPT